MRSLWKDSQVKGKSPLELLVYRSRLIGSESKLCVWGGGNTSSKMVEKDHLGRTIQILRVKGSGSDLKSCVPRDFSPLKLEEVLPAIKRTAMTDEEMVDYLNCCLSETKAPRPSIEALLHAFLRYQAIDHTHADAILSLTNTRRPKQICEEVYGNELIFVPYVKPGFDLAKKLAAEVDRHPECKGAILEKHGIITWGDDSKTSYLRMIEMVTRAEHFIQQKASNRKPFGGQKVKPFPPRVREAFIDRFMPELRKTLSQPKSVVLHLSDSDPILEFVCSKDAPRVSQQGPATPDHMLRTKRIPCFLPHHLSLTIAKQSVRYANETGGGVKPASPAGRRSFKRQLEAYALSHKRYYKKFADPGMFMLNPYPAVILIPGVGMITSGKDLDSALITAEIYEHSIFVMRAASFIDRYVSLSPREAFKIEYWPLELYKLSLAPPEKELARKIALVTGACGGIGRAVVRRLASAGAQVVATDTDAEKVRILESEINSEFKAKKVLGFPMDVTKKSSVHLAFQKILWHLGGLDIVVSNAGVATVAAIEKLSLAEWEKNLAVNATGHFIVLGEAMRLMKRQGLGGRFIFMVTKNVLAPGAEFGAYSASKAACAQLARIVAIEGAPFRIRSNMVNPDGVFKDSGLWSKIKKDRAKTFGIAETKLEEYYQKRNLLQVRVEPDDVAETVLFLSSDRSAKTTGAILPVDGGLREAFPR